MSNSKLLSRLEALSPIQQVGLCQAILGRLTATPKAINDAAQALDPTVRDDPAFQALATEARDDPAGTLNKAASAAVAKTFLFAAAADPDFSPLVEMELEQFRDEKQFVVETLALSAAVSMIIVVATTRFKYADGKIEIEKEVASPELVKQAMMITNHAAPTTQ